jgi:hypothetical protein
MAQGEMTPVTSQSAAASCDYCGRENPDRLPVCTGCGTPLVSAPPPTQTEPQDKSKLVAVCLALIFGPLGLLYVKAWWPAFVMILITVPLTITRTGGLWLAIVSRILCCIWAYNSVTQQAEKTYPRREAERLLDEAARLESLDRAKAVETYEDIIRLYPDAPAAKEAARNIQTLRRQM